MSGKMRTMTPMEAVAALELSGQYHRGEIALPPYITEKQHEVAEANRRAALFLAVTGAVDEGMVYDAVQRRLELDGLYGRWASEHSRGLIARPTPSTPEPGEN